ncbi:unnamed protein product [Adineta steineri]|uniref:EF-hand domain-containing protein n=1 Tax=Adineta steineri TaxID=433720 RepID=A0A819VUF5_9BILA|nr:unnamed protein product [Adineta steineri]
MGGRNSKKSFNEWDLIKFSNVTGVTLPLVKNIHKDFVTATGNDNRMNKIEFRHLYKKMYINTEYISFSGDLPSMFSEEDLNKMSDYVFETYDFEGTGLLTFEEFAEAYLMITHHPSMSTNGITLRDRFSYILDQDNSTPGFITREQGERIFHRLNKYNKWINSKTNILDDSLKPVDTTWDSHWSKLNDGNGSVSKEKFVDYITTSNEYKYYFDPMAV